MEWPSQSPDLNPIEILLGDLKWAVHARNPSNIAQLRELYMEEWAKISPSRCQKRLDSFCNFKFFVYYITFIYTYCLTEDQILICSHMSKKRNISRDEVHEVNFQILCFVM